MFSDLFYFEMYQAEIITIGDELLRGRTANTNAQWLSKKLFMMGFAVTRQTTVPDKAEWLYSALGDAIQRVDVVVTTGGLGPTVDDNTRVALSRFLGEELIFDQRIAQKIRQWFIKRGMEMPEVNLRQAYLPKNTVPIENSDGLAPGIFARKNGKLIFLLPGPPKEMEAVFRTVEAILTNEFQTKTQPMVIFRTIGVPESLIQQWLAQIEIPGVELSFYPSLSGVDIVAFSQKKTSLAKLKNKIAKKIGVYTYTQSGEEITIEQVIGDILQQRKETLAIAESCTGGMLSSKIVDIPGSSDYFTGGIVAYSNEVKIVHLGVSANDLKEFGAVSSQVAEQMAIGVRRKLGSTYGIGITGIAGPGGGTPTKQVGLVYIALATSKKTFVRKYTFLGNRNAIRTRATTSALNILWVYLTFPDIYEYPFEDGGKWV